MRRFIKRTKKEYKPFVPWNKGLKGILIGRKDSKSTFWRGGEIQRIRNYDWYKVRREVLNRDNFTCYKCSYKGHLHKRANDKYELCVHHKNGYRYETGNKNDLDKLITFCSSCHTSEEWKLTLKYRAQLRDIQQLKLLSVKVRLNI